MIYYEPPYIIIRHSIRMDHRPRLAPVSKRDKQNDQWLLEDSAPNIEYLISEYTASEMSPGFKARILKHKSETKPQLKFPAGHEFVFPPMEMQKKVLNDAWQNKNHALFLEMGCGKTFVTINLAMARYAKRSINALLVIAPTSVKPVWEIEFEKFCNLPYELRIMTPNNKRLIVSFIQGESRKLKVFVVGVEALSQGGAFNTAQAFVREHKTMMVVDESSRIKNPKAGRTAKAISLGDDSKFKLVLTGTSITQGIQDLYSQFRFLDWRITGMKSYYTFQNRYCIMGGFEGKKVVGYRNIGELMDKLAPHTSIVKKHQMMDLPPKVYEKRTVQPSAEQKKALKELGDPFAMATTVDGKTLEVETVLERMTRYQQIVGGHFPWKEGQESHIMPMPGTNPKMAELKVIIEDMPTHAKAIIWCRFRVEADWIEDMLTSNGHSVVTYNGDTPQQYRKEVLEDFQDINGPRFFVSSPAMGGLGITLTAATYTIYYSNTFSLEDRLQSEDRNHRKGQDNKVTYIDLVMDHDIDHSMTNALLNKKEVADYVTQELQDRANTN